MATLKQLIDTIKDAAINDFSDELASVFYEKYADTQKEKSFPRLSFFVADGGISFGLNSNQVVFDLEFLDLLSGQNNERELRRELISDLIDLASRFTTKLYYDKGLNIQYPINVTPKDKKYKDGLSSVEVTLTINLARPCLSN